MLTSILLRGLCFAVLVHESFAAACVCAKTNVNIRSGPGTWKSKVGLLSVSKCLRYSGVRRVAGSYRWANVIHNGKSAWIADKYLRFKTCPPPVTVNTGTSGCSGVRIISRSQWGASAANNINMRGTPRNIFIHHTAGRSCNTQAACSAQMRSIQSYHKNGRGYRDIAYSFLIGEDGNVYEGRGWGKKGGHTLNYNHNSLGFCVIGTFTNRLPNYAARTALTRLINCAKASGKVVQNYRLRGHRDVRATSCPGTTFYNHIRTWPNYR